MDRMKDDEGISQEYLCTIMDIGNDMGIDLWSAMVRLGGGGEREKKQVQL